MRPRVSRRLAASAVVTAARATVLRSARLLSFAGAATREQRAVEVIANMMIDASVLMTNAPIPRRPVEVFLRVYPGSAFPRSIVLV